MRCMSLYSDIPTIKHITGLLIGMIFDPSWLSTKDTNVQNFNVFMYMHRSPVLTELWLYYMTLYVLYMYSLYISVTQ